MHHTAPVADAPKLKDYFTPAVISDIGRRIQLVHDAFDVEAFTDGVLAPGWDDLTFTARSRLIGDVLWHGIGLDVAPSLAVLTTALPGELEDPEGVLNERFWLWPFGDAIATHASDHMEAGLDACEALTKCFTAEFAIRPFLAKYPEALDRLSTWTSDPSEHVRRLASEGARPRLPWATRLDLPIERIIDVLTRLRADPSPYVRRSVANHLNDLAKADSDRIVDLLETWHAEGVEETTWIVRHAMRNHLKSGDPRVLAMFGYDKADVEVLGLQASPTAAAIGQSVAISFDLAERAGNDQKLMVDLVVGYRKANGSVGPKVFKFKDFELAGHRTESCSKKLDMIVRSTRPLYPGEHSVTVRVNGADLATTTFELTP